MNPDIQRFGGKDGTVTRFKEMLGPLRAPARRFWRETRPKLLAEPYSLEEMVLESDGFFESSGTDLIHCPGRSGSKGLVRT